MKEKKAKNNPPKPVLYGPDNPHTLSTIKTELVWDGKYDCHGNRREVDIAGAAMPMQKIEIVDDPRSRKEAQGLLFNSKELEALKERAMKSGMDFIDFWAVDFEWEPGKPFNHHWQDYRTRKDRSLKTVSDAMHDFPGSGTYTAYVKVVDTFGCDTSITVEISL